MTRILNIETATPLCSVVLSDDGKILSIRETLEEKSHAAQLAVFINEILNETGTTIKDLHAIAVGKGPGSYTGLRIGISTAKGICYGANLPLIATGTLDIMTMQVMHTYSEQIHQWLNIPGTLLCPLIDARRMEVFTSFFDHKGQEYSKPSAIVIDHSTFKDILKERRVIFFGSGMKKCKPLLEHNNAFFIEDVLPHASALSIIAQNKFHRKDFEDIAYFEPFYLKDFIATISKKGLRD